MAHRTRSLRIDRVFPGIGRIALACGTTLRTERTKIAGLLTRLYDHPDLRPLLRALKSGDVTLPELLAADAENRLADLKGERRRLERPLWPAVEAWTPEDGTPTQRRYAVSFRQLKRANVLAAEATVADLAAVDWPAVERGWEGSGADWNHLRRALSKFLSDLLETDDVPGQDHPFRVRLLRKRSGNRPPLFPRRAERPRVPDLSPALFWQVVNHVPELVRPQLVTLAGTGLRVGELLRLTETDLLPATCAIRVPGTKTAASAATLPVDPSLWPWVVAAVPAPVQYKWLRTYWKRGLKAAGADPTLRLHDLRHCTGQWLTDAGRPEASVQRTLRHASPAMTRRYTMQRDRGEDARTMAGILFPDGAPSLAPRPQAASTGR
jgi:integrase